MYTVPVSEFTEYREKTGECARCGNSAVNHRAMFVLQTMNVWIGRLPFFLGSRRPKRIAALFAWISERADRIIYPLMHAIGIVRFSHDPARAKTYRSQVVWEEAVRRGIEMEQIVILGSLTDLYRARLNGAWFYFESLPVPKTLERGAYLWLDDKFLLKSLLSRHGIPVPKYFSATNMRDAMHAFQTLGGKVVAKPQSGSRGRHTSTGIGDTEALREGYDSARELCRYVCIEEHLEGSVCRATVVNGTLAGFFQADAPRVTGDGTATIRELVERQNSVRHERVGEIVLGAEHEAHLRRRGLMPESIVPAGERVDITHRTGRLFGGETRELLSSVHPKLKAYVEQAARVLDVPIVGFDLIIRDPERDPDGERWGIIEANSLPFIDLHYLPLHGEPSNVAARVWDLWRAAKSAPSGALPTAV